MNHINVHVQHVLVCRLYTRVGTDRSLLTGHDALLLRQIARDLLHALSHRHDYTWTAFVEPVVRSWMSTLSVVSQADSI